MTTLGHDQFSVVGHDRGAHTAFRMAMDHPHLLAEIYQTGLGSKACRFADRTWVELKLQTGSPDNTLTVPSKLADLVPGRTIVRMLLEPDQFVELVRGEIATVFSCSLRARF